MTASELITPQHLARKAIVYIRQSTPHQAISNQESLRLQYALRSRALELGWPAAAIEIIDCDLGTTAASAAHREGFKELLTQVTLGEVGIILSFDVTRLSRNCSDWYPLLDVCGYKGCLIGDRDGLYDPGSANGRLLLGLKGQISELELHTIRARLTAGLLNKAAVSSPSPCRWAWCATPAAWCTNIPTSRSKAAWPWSSRPSCRCARRAKSCGYSTPKR